MVTFDMFAIVVMCLLVLYVQRAGVALKAYRGTRLVTCPATGLPAAVELAAWRGAMLSFFRKPALRVHQCSEWPARQGCDQICARQIAADPQDTLVSSIVTRWYQGKDCTCCGVALGAMHSGPHQPGLMNAERKMIEWREIPPQDIPGALASASPVCATCLTAETQSW